MGTLNEELESYRKDINYLTDKKKALNDTSVDNFFEKLNKEQKQKMINISSTIVEKDNEENETNQCVKLLKE